jgi:hypothetical protein
VCFNIYWLEEIDQTRKTLLREIPDKKLKHKCCRLGFKQIRLIEISKDKGKAIPLQALTGPEGSRRLRLPDFKTIGT